MRGVNEDHCATYGEGYARVSFVRDQWGICVGITKDNLRADCEGL